MRHRLVLILAGVAILFSVDAAVSVGFQPAALPIVVAAAIGLAWLLFWLAGLVVSASPRRRGAGVLGFNVVAVLPALEVLRRLDSIDPDFVAPVLRATVVWLAIALVWTTTVIGHAAGRRPRETSSSPVGSARLRDAMSGTS